MRDTIVKGMSQLQYLTYVEIDKGNELLRQGQQEIRPLNSSLYSVRQGRIISAEKVALIRSIIREQHKLLL